MSIVENGIDSSIDTQQVDLLPPIPQPGDIRINAIDRLLIPHLKPVPEDENVWGGINLAMTLDQAGQVDEPVGPVGVSAYIDPWFAQSEDEQFRVRARYLDAEQSNVVADGEVVQVNERVNTRLSLFRDGPCELYVGVFRLSAGSPVTEDYEEQSPRLPVLVKTTIPGDNLPMAALQVSADVLRNGVTKDFFDNDSEGDVGLDVTVLPYPYMRKNDIVFVYWGGAPATFHQVDAAEVGLPLVITIPRDKIEQAGDSPAMVVDYRVLDVVQNRSQRSHPLSLKVSTKLDLLPAPIVNQADADNEIFLPDLLGEVVEVVCASGTTPFASESTLELVWDGVNVNGNPVNHRQSFTFPKVIRTHIFKVPYAFAHLIAQGRALVWCKLTSGALTRESRRVCIGVNGPVSLLPAPRVRDAAGGELKSDIAATQVRVFQISDALARDTVRLYWKGTDRNGNSVLDYITQRTLNDEMAQQDILFEVLGENIAPLRDGLLDVYYEHYRNGMLLATSERLSLFIDTSVTQLAAPTVPLAPGDLLIPSDPASDVEALILKYPDMRALDHIEFYWVASDSARNWRDEVVLGIGAEGFNVSIPIPASVIADFLGERVELVYTVTSVAPRLRRISARRVLTIQAAVAVPEILALKDQDNVSIARNGTSYSPLYSLTGTRSAGAAVEILADGKSITTVPAGAQTLWTSPQITLEVGLHRLTVRTPGSLKASAPWPFIRLLASPVTIAKLFDSNGVSIANGGSTLSTQVLLNGTGTPGEQVQILRNGTVLETIPVDADGNWTYTIGSLAERVHRFLARPIPANRPDSNEWVVTIRANWVDIVSDFSNHSYDNWRLHNAARCGSIRGWQGALRFCNFTDFGAPTGFSGTIFYRDVEFVPGSYQFRMRASHIAEGYVPGLVNPVLEIVDSVDARPYNRVLPKDGVIYDFVLAFTVNTRQWRRLYVNNHQDGSNGNDFVIFDISVKRLSGGGGGIQSVPESFNELPPGNEVWPALDLPLPKKR